MQIHPWNIVFLFGFVAYVIIRGVFEQRSKNNEKVVSRIDSRDLFLIFIMAVGGMILPSVYLFTPWLGFADYRLPTFVPWFGATMMMIALWLFWRSHADWAKTGSAL